jgi:hypothetical protein
MTVVFHFLAFMCEWPNFVPCILCRYFLLVRPGKFAGPNFPMTTGQLNVCCDNNSLTYNAQIPESIFGENTTLSHFIEHVKQQPTVQFELPKESHESLSKPITCPCLRWDLCAHILFWHLEANPEYSPCCYFFLVWADWLTILNPWHQVTCDILIIFTFPKNLAILAF